jgi:hypothetical protein
MPAAVAALAAAARSCATSQPAIFLLASLLI